MSVPFFYNEPPCKAPRPFSLRPFRRFLVKRFHTYNVGPFLTLPLAYVSGFGALITLLLLSSSPAYAEWVQVSNSDEAGKTRYVDPATIRPNRNLVKMWQFYDQGKFVLKLLVPRGLSFLSSASSRRPNEY